MILELIIGGLLIGAMVAAVEVLKQIRDKRVKEYRIVRGKTLRELGKTVNQALQMGFQPVGGIYKQTEPEEHADGVYWHQVVVKYNI